MSFLNVASRLVEIAERMPESVAIAEPRLRCFGTGSCDYRTVTFRGLNVESDRIARALVDSGVTPGMRLVLMVRQGIDFVAAFYALLKAGVVVVLIDPGMGMRRMVDCLEEAEPDGFVAISLVQAMRCCFPRRFPKARYNLTVGKRWFWGGLSLRRLRSDTRYADPEPVLAATRPDDPAAIIFTSGSTGPPKGVLYTHRVFDTQAAEVGRGFGIDPGGIDLAGFPFFGLFNAAMGTTAVIPEMDPTRPANVDPRKFLAAANEWKVTQSFGSPALWNRVCSYCERHGTRIPTLRRCILAGAPISPKLLARVAWIIAADGEVYTPYGATESLPVALIGAREVLGETAEKTREGNGICVGTRFASIDWKVIRITDEPIATIDGIHEVPVGEIGELIVRGPQVTQCYVTGEADANRKSKIYDAEHDVFWHRMGDVGHLDEKERFWFCGRKGHRVETEHGTLFSIPCEAIFNRHEQVYRCALAGASRDGTLFREPWMFVEPLPEHFPHGAEAREKLLAELEGLAKSSPLTENIKRIAILEKFPVDVRHNAKINRERLSEIATQELTVDS